MKVILLLVGESVVELKLFNLATKWCDTNKFELWYTVNGFNALVLKEVVELGEIIEEKDVDGLNDLIKDLNIMIGGGCIKEIKNWKLGKEIKD